MGAGDAVASRGALGSGIAAGSGAGDGTGGGRGGGRFLLGWDWRQLVSQSLIGQAKVKHHLEVSVWPG